VPRANPLVQGGAVGGAAAPPAADGSANANTEPPGTASGYGIGGFTHPDNTSLHCAILVGGALLGLVALRFLGFRFAVDAGVTGS
jgi:hypothetical protein